jgi:hypothetical protein
MIERLEREAGVINQKEGVETDVQEPDGKAVVVRTEVFDGQIHGWIESEFLPYLSRWNDTNLSIYSAICSY